MTKERAITLIPGVDAAMKKAMRGAWLAGANGCVDAKRFDRYAGAYGRLLRLKERLADAASRTEVVQ